MLQSRGRQPQNLTYIQSLVTQVSVNNMNLQHSITNLIFMDLYIVDYSVEILPRCSFVTEFIILKFTEGSTCFERHTTHYQEL
jgi:hypothetical protein